MSLRLSLRRVAMLAAAALLAGVAIWQVTALGTAGAATTSDDWPSYVADNARSGFNSHESALTASNVGSLKTLWTRSGAGSVSDQPMESGGTVYWGSWNGYLHAASVGGTTKWDTFLGTATHSGCNPSTAGVASSPAIGTAGSTSAVFVGGGDAKVYAVNASTGAVLWSTLLGTPNEAFMWGSPAAVGGSVYIGVSSLADCPLVQGKLVKLDAATGAIQASLNIVPNGCIGGGIWGSPSVTADGATLYVATGTWHACGTTGEPLSAALLQVRTADLTVQGHWQLPGAEIQTADIEFGSAPTLMDFTSGGRAVHDVAVGAKDGMFYAFAQGSVSAGPLWKVSIDANGTSPQGGDGILSPAAWDGTRLYVAGGRTTISGTACKGAVRALNPATGAFEWQHCLAAGPVLGPVSEYPGVVVAAGGNQVIFLSTGTGSLLHTFSAASGVIFYSGAAVARGHVFIGDMSGNFYAFGLPSTGAVTIQAEAAGNTLGGTAMVATCATCMGGAKVRFLGNGAANTVTIPVNESAVGSHQLTVYGEVDGTRSFQVSVNGGTAVTVSLTGTSWSTPVSAAVTVTLPAGTDTMTFGNTTAYAPDMDAVTIN
jgi:outer membrane protein assembly factor BamB